MCENEKKKTERRRDTRDEGNAKRKKMKKGRKKNLGRN